MIKRIKASDKVLEELTVAYKKDVNPYDAQIWADDLGKYPYLVFAYLDKYLLEVNNMIYFKLSGDKVLIKMILVTIKSSLKKTSIDLSVKID